MIEYRREIDGLRAVAVFPVVLFHAGFSAFSGGYVGVDVFFVISGYLITSIILSDMSGSGFSIIRFYERRARRILPALFFVVLCTLPFAYLYMLPNQTVDFGQSIVSVALFFSNFQFWSEAGYFGASAEQMPLLHSWSLSVEEQFYVVFPLVLAAMAQVSKRVRFAVMALALIISLAVTEYALGIAASAAYFWSPFRAWELLIGVLLALHVADAGRPRAGLWAETGGLLGLGLIGYSVVAFDSETPFPGVWALLPTLGTGLILYCTSGQTLVGRLLSVGPVVGLGLISYSVYLWHQPLYAFARLIAEGEPGLPIMVALVFAAFALGYISWRYVEKPFRNPQRISRARIFQFSGLGIATLIVVGFAVQYDHGLRYRFEAKAQAAMAGIENSPLVDKCQAGIENQIPPAEACRYFGPKTTFAALGDSHVTGPAYMLAKRLEARGEGLYHLAYGAGFPAFTLPIYKAEYKWSNGAVDFLATKPAVHTVLLGYRHSGYINGQNFGHYPKQVQTSYLKRLELDWAASTDAYWQSFEAGVMRLLDVGKRVVIMLPVPELGRSIEQVVYRTEWQGDAVVGVPRAYYEARNAAFFGKLNNSPILDRVILVDPADFLCDAENCYAVRDGKSLYYDDDHLSLEGAALLADAILAAIAAEGGQAHP